MATIAEHFPQTCPFCNIAKAYPTPTASNTDDLRACIPTTEAADPTRLAPECFLVLNSDSVMAFLDIMPMTRGHLLVATRAHRQKVEDMEPEESRDIGFMLPILARAVTKVINVTDYNIVQNNGERAAQVVPHVHFHIIPRPAQMPVIQNKSWTMFGRGMREDLDEGEAAELAATLRNAVREEMDALMSRGRL